MEHIIELLVTHKRITFEMLPGGTYRVTIGRPGCQVSGQGTTMTGAMGLALYRSQEPWPPEDE